MRMCIQLDEILVRVAPEKYTKHVSTNGKGKMFLLVLLLNALYLILKTPLLYYKLFVKDLKSV